MTDSQLIELLRRREQAGIEALQRQYGPLMGYIMGPILSDPREREECLSDVTMAIWKKIDTYAPENGTFSAWLTVITRNAALNRQRGVLRKSAEPLDETMKDPDPTPEESLLRKERSEQIARAVQTLSDSDKNLFYRKYFYLQSTAQMAAELGLTKRAVEGRLHRLRKQLRKTLGGVLDDE